MIQEGREGRADKVKKLRDRESQDGWRQERQKRRGEGREVAAGLGFGCSDVDNMAHIACTVPVENKRLFKNEKSREHVDWIYSASHNTLIIMKQTQDSLLPAKPRTDIMQHFKRKSQNQRAVFFFCFFPSQGQTCNRCYVCFTMESRMTIL